MADNNIVNVIYLGPGNAIDGTVTGTAVVHVDQGDDVFIRTGLLSNGNILSDVNGRSSFAGWILILKKKTLSNCCLFISITISTFKILIICYI